jgi:hypothetical protein
VKFSQPLMIKHEKWLLKKILVHYIKIKKKKDQNTSILYINKKMKLNCVCFFVFFLSE